MQFKSKLRTILLVLLFIFVAVMFIVYKLFSSEVSSTSKTVFLYYFLIITALALIAVSLLFIYLKRTLLHRLEDMHTQLQNYKVKQPREFKVSGQQPAAKDSSVKATGEANPDTQLVKEDQVRIVHYDDLTNLPNSLFFNEILNKSISHAKRHHNMLAILLIDIDNFDYINQNYSKEVGDHVLQEISQRLKSILRSDDILARAGADEFRILLNAIDDPKYAGPVAAKILNTCHQAIKINNNKIKLQTSIGIAIYPDDGDSLEDLQKKADSALFKAKRLGGGIYQYFRQELDAAAHEHIKMESALRKAIDNNELVLYFQPQLSLENGTIKSVEALLRWEHPELGLLTPERFIPLAEETGLILPIGEWALREACKINKGWQNAGYEPIVVSVNISALQFKQQNLHAIIEEALQEYNLPSACFEIEITETTVMDNVDLAINKLNNLRDMGISIALDDFGTGYTSINYLKQFPVNVLKIDQTFIKGIPHNQNDLAITSAVISLGHNLGLDVVAEGVETIEQIQYLAENNCDLIQGYFLSRPLPASKIVLQFSKR